MHQEKEAGLPLNSSNTFSVMLPFGPPSYLAEPGLRPLWKVRGVGADLTSGVRCSKGKEPWHRRPFSWTPPALEFLDC